MDRGAWQATVHRLTERVGHDLVTKQQHLTNKINNKPILLPKLTYLL